MCGSVEPSGGYVMRRVRRVRNFGGVLGRGCEDRRVIVGLGVLWEVSAGYITERETLCEIDRLWVVDGLNRWNFRS